MRRLMLIGLMVLAGCGGRNPAAGPTPGRAGDETGNGLAALPGNEAIPELVDHPGRFKGKTLRLKLTVKESIRQSEGQSLQDFAGKDVKLFGFAPGSTTRVDLVVKLPDTRGAIPNAGHDSDLPVTFLCNDGSLRAGNVATVVARP